jgi:glycosyltransferase involved in cell wall biosynthesis
MMKIIIAVYGTSIAGGNRAIFEVANRLSSRGYDARIVALGGDHSWFNVKIPVYYVKAPRFIRLAKPLIRIYKLLKYGTTNVGIANYFDVDGFARLLGFRADLVRALAEELNEFEADVAIATFYPSALSVWLSNSNKKLYFVQDIPELVRETDGEYGLRLFKLTLLLPFRFLANSIYTKNFILSYNKDAKVTVTGVGVDTTIFYPRHTKAVDSRGKPAIMAIIRRAKFKGGNIALKALNIINNEMSIYAILVSEGNAVEQLFREVKPEYSYIVFKDVGGETIAKLYSSADVFIFTSYKESFGLPPLEAMASGVPVVTTDCGGIRDYAVDGYNALVIQPGDPNAVAEAVLKILKDDKLREKLIEHGIQTAKQWTWEKVVDKFEQAIKGS